MGRIADALKKAEQQRKSRHPDAAEADLPTPAGAGGDRPESAATEAVELDPAEEYHRLHPDRTPRVEGMHEALVAHYEPSGVISEQYRGLRTRLLTQNPDNEHRILAITSSLPRDGKSITALNMAFIMAEIRHLKVLVVDGDFRRSSLADMLNVDPSPGLADVLRGEAELDEVIRPTPSANLCFAAAGKTHGRSAAEILSSTRAARAFAQLRNRFHYTIVDTPPASTVSDVGIIGQYCNGVVMVVRLHSTPEPAAKRAVRVLQANNIPILGTILVGRAASAGGYGYYRYYRYYYNYYRYYGSRDKDQNERDRR